MRLRSLLFVPGDRPDRMQKAFAAGADALILDLEDAVAPQARADARHHIAEFIQAVGGHNIWVRVNPLTSQDNPQDLDAIAPARPHGIVLPKSEGWEHVDELANRLTERGNVSAQIMPIATETPAAIFGLGSYKGAKRLAALTWGAEDLPAAIGATSSREEDGSYTAPYEVARALTLFGAAAAGVSPIETVYPDFKDLDGLRDYARCARRDGFHGMMAIHPSQVAVINDAFTPSEAEVAHARAVVSAFEDQPGVGALSLDGRMIDRPHLVQARRLLASLS